MQRIRSQLVGLDGGDLSIFSDFEDGGEMWTGRGPREKRCAIEFSDAFAKPPRVQATISLWDADTSVSIRAEVVAENVTNTGCDIVFRTWGDSRFARIRVAWTAIGELPDPDVWELY
ncbi:MAG: H-type lectin domain-containing protein [Paracoccaceae bacterium]